jgi:hypothetical protein
VKEKIPIEDAMKQLEDKAAERKRKKELRDDMFEAMVKRFRQKYPTPKQGLDYISANRTMPNRRAARIFLTVVYDLNEEQVNKLLPKRRRLRLPKYKTITEQE